MHANLNFRLIYNYTAKSQVFVAYFATVACLKIEYAGRQPLKIYQLEMRVVRQSLQKPVFSSLAMSAQFTSSSTPTKKIQNYLIYLRELLGTGNFSQVYRGINTATNQAVAIKVIDLAQLYSPALRQLLQSQISVLRLLKHPNILRCHDIFTSNNNCYIVTELCDGGDLETKRKGMRVAMDEMKCRTIICDVYQGLLYLAENAIVHRDVKVANVFVRDGVAKIADFGFARKASDHFKDINVGSPIYMSPEGLIQSMYGPKTDVWAFGILIYQLLHGDPPLAFCNYENDLKIYIRKPVTSYASFMPTIPPDLKDLILKCLEVDERRRIGMKDIQFHPYIQRAMRELGRAPASARNGVFARPSRQDLGRSNSVDNLEIRNQLTRTVSEDKLRYTVQQFTTPTKLQLKTQASNPYLQTSPLLEQAQLSTHKLQLHTGGSTATTTTNSSQQGSMTFDQSLYLLHYCRLLYKAVNLMLKTPITSVLKFGEYSLSDCYVNWLLDTIDDLQQRTPTNEASERQKKLKFVLGEYQARYNRELKRNRSINIREESIRSASKQFLEFIDSHLIENPGEFQQELVTLGFWLLAIIEVTDTLQQCRQRGQYSLMINCKPVLDSCLSSHGLSLAAYMGVRGRGGVGGCM